MEPTRENAVQVLLDVINEDDIRYLRINKQNQETGETVEYSCYLDGVKVTASINEDGTTWGVGVLIASTFYYFSPSMRLAEHIKNLIEKVRVAKDAFEFSTSAELEATKLAKMFEDKLGTYIYADQYCIFSYGFMGDAVYSISIRINKEDCLTVENAVRELSSPFTLGKNDNPYVNGTVEYYIKIKENK